MVNIEHVGDDCHIKPGTRVSLNCPELPRVHGWLGTVDHWDDETKRYLVHVDGFATGCPMLFHSEELREPPAEGWRE